MNTSRAICTLESMAIDMVGTLGGLDKASPIAPVLERQIEAINKAQDALRAVRDLATNENASHISIDRMNEIMQAERERRLVILPCKRGETVWCLVWDRSVVWPDESRRKIITRTFDLDDVFEVGKTVFLTREEAEKALEEGTE